MRFFRSGESSSRQTDQPPQASSDGPWDSKDGGEQLPATVHQETVSPKPEEAFAAPGPGGDTAAALFADAPLEEYTKDEERRLVRKIDFMIIPYLAVCYAFFYIDKTTLSYAAIFGIREDLNLVGTDYSWLSSMFYFVRGPTLRMTLLSGGHPRRTSRDPVSLLRWTLCSCP